MDYKKLDAIVDSYKDEIIRDIRSWVAVPSVMAAPAGNNAPFGAEVRRMLDLALKTAQDYGFATRNLDGYCGDVTLCEGRQTLGMLCHLDVVPAGDGWTKDPWGGEIENGRIFGRGTMDDKGPALAALHAMRAVREAGIPMADGVRLILGCDEETGMTDMEYYKSKLPTPDYGFSPDAEFPVINIEKGGLSLTLSRYTGTEDGAEIPVYELFAGIRCNVVPGIATARVGYARIGMDELARRIERVTSLRGFRLVIDDLGDGAAKITAEGLSAHASTPELGENAAGMLLIALKDIGAGGGSRDAIAALAGKIGMEYDGESLGIKISDEESGALTCNLGILRFDGRNISAQLDIRYPLCADEEKMCGQAAMAISGTGLSLCRNGGHTPHHVPSEHKVVKGLVKVYSEVTGQPGYAFAIGGGTYSRCMPNTVAFGFNFPGDTDTCHMPDEYVDIEKFMLSVKIFAHAIAELAGAEAE